MFDALLTPRVWLSPLAWQAGLTVAGVVLGLGLAVVLSLVVPNRSVATAVRTVLGYLPALGVVLIAAVFLGTSWWPWLTVGLIAVVVFAAIWAAILESGELVGEQAIAARALDLPRREVVALGRGRVRRGVTRAMPPVWRRALTISTLSGLLATALPADTTGAEQHGLGGLIAVGLRAGEYPPALPGAVWLIVLALAGEGALRLVRPRGDLVAATGAETTKDTELSDDTVLSEDTVPAEQAAPTKGAATTEVPSTRRRGGQSDADAQAT